MESSFSNGSDTGEASSSGTEIRINTTCFRSQRSFKDIANRFSERTSWVGPGYIGSSRTWHARVIWVCLFLASLGGTCYMIYLNINEFLVYKTRIGLYMGFSPLTFPMVSVCNTNPVRRSQVNNILSDSFRDFLEKIANDSGESTGAFDFLYQDVDYNASEGNDYSYSYYDYYSYDYYGYDEDAVKDPRYQVMEQFKQLYGAEDSNTKAMIGHQLEDMLIFCSFGGLQCGPEHFTMAQSSEFGNCYNFNAASNTNLTSRRSGNANGLQLILNLENNEYIAGLTSGYGARLVVTEPGAMSLPEHNGIFISAATETDVGLKLINITRLDKPYSDCANNNDAEDFAEYQDRFRYTRQACQATCVHVRIMKECKCYMASQLYLYPDTIFHDETMKPCSRNQSSCVEHLIMSNNFYENLTCSCPNPCWEQSYDLMLSSRNWPTNSYVGGLQNVICKNPLQADQCDNLDYAESMSEKRQNFLKVNIFYRDMNYENIIEEPDYPASKFFSDLGGSAGFFLGLTVLSFIELLELIMEICEWSLERLFGHDPRKPGRQPSDKKSQILQDNNSVGLQIHNLDRMNCEPVRYYSGK